jgi:hypothetical protein
MRGRISARMTTETTARIEPARLEEPTAPIADTIAELAAAAATLGKALHPRTAANLVDLVRIMNTYYSNLIEGHDTRPRDIERASGVCALVSQSLPRPGYFHGQPVRAQWTGRASGDIRPTKSTLKATSSGVAGGGVGTRGIRARRGRTHHRACGAHCATGVERSA